MKAREVWESGGAGVVGTVRGGRFCWGDLPEDAWRGRERALRVSGDQHPLQSPQGQGACVQGQRGSLWVWGGRRGSVRPCRARGLPGLAGKEMGSGGFGLTCLLFFFNF